MYISFNFDICLAQTIEIDQKILLHANLSIRKDFSNNTFK